MPSENKRWTLILGGARSGKSHHAQQLARERGEASVLYVATAEPLDDEMRARIADHQAERPETWVTLEAPLGVGALIGATEAQEVVLLDCLTLLVSNVLVRNSERSDQAIDEAVDAEIDALLACYQRGTASWIVVSNEVGLGLVPDNRLGRLFRDLLGRANQRLAAQADEVLFMVAGIPWVVKSEAS